MRRIRTYGIGIILIISLSFISSTQGCDIENAKSKCLKNLDTGFSLLKSYEIASKEEEHSFIFSKSVNYMLTSAPSQSTESKIEIRLYNHKRKLIFSNYNKKKDVFYKVIYPCTYTGIHYISFVDHTPGKQQCNAGVLAFKRNR